MLGRECERPGSLALPLPFSLQLGDSNGAQIQGLGQFFFRYFQIHLTR